jgi:hypothetical protein
MKNCLLFLAIVGVMLVAAPAHSQYLFLDTNGDGKNSQNPLYPPNTIPSDVLNSAVHSVDVYFVTNANRNGSPSVCSAGEPDFQINSYEFILRSSGSGSVTYGAWTDNMSGYLGGNLCGDGTVCQGGSDIWVAKYKFTYDPPGKYKVGSLAITVTGSPKLDFAASSSLHSLAETAFGSSCSGSQGDHTIRLGIDFTEADGTAGSTPVTSTTWGKIKSLYH